MNRRVLVIATLVELLSSFFLYARAPTDGVHVWYPSIWAYVGEHALVWALFISSSFLILRKRSVNDALTFCACFASEVAATFYVWFMIPLEGDFPRAWYTGRFVDYFRMRLISWCILAASASLFYWFRFKRIPKRTQVPG